MPKILYQIQTKFRDEARPRFGVVRSKEFIMKDAYSFDANEEGLNKSYDKMFNAYCSIFKRCGLDFIVVNADPGIMGGKESAEFMVLTEAGEDMVKGKCAMELGHVFKLGTKYTKALEANFLDKDGKAYPIIMGCYGIGINRIIAAAIEKHNDEKGIIWPKEISPYSVIIIPLKMTDPKIVEASEKIYKELEGKGISCLLDDRDISAGVKFNDADLIGIPLQVVIGPNSIKNSSVELKQRGKDSKDEVKISEAVKRITSQI